MLPIPAQPDASPVAAPPNGPVSAQGFRDAVALLAGGVAIVTCWDGEIPRGLLVSALTTVSVDPPRMLFCVRKAASAHDALLAADHCALAILAERDRGEAERFSTTARSGERFEPSRWRLDTDAPPRHRAPLVGLDGVISRRIDAGANTIFILDVTQAQADRDRPLVYFDRSFRSLRFTEDLVAGPESLTGVTVWSASGA